VLVPPVRRPPARIFLRFRHPESKAIAKVTVEGKPWTRFDAKREWVELPVLKERTTITAHYGQ